TITENTIQLVRRVDIDGNDDEKVYFYSYLNSYFHSGLKTSNDDAVLAISGINVEDYEKIDEIPYDFTRRRITIVVRKANEQFLIAKGDPDDILRTCITCEEGTCAYDMDEESVERIRNKYEDLSSEGFRVLSIAYKSVPIENRQYSINDETDLIFLGFIAFIDPPREDATEAFQKLYRAGVKVKILTGDNEIFTQRIMEQLNIPVEGVLVGQDMIYDTDEALARMVEKTNVFARVTPGQKSRILNTLKSNGHVVGFLGDGINDASTITNADVGISSSNAVSIAKQSADIILDPKNLSNLCDGIIIARRTFSNTLKYMLLATSSRYGNMVSLALIAVFLPFVPLLPRQILLTNLLSDITYSAIPTDNVDDNVLTKPRKLDISYIRKFMLIIGPVSSLMDILTFLIVAFLIIGGNPSDFTLDQQQIVQTCLFLEFLITEIVEVFALRTPSSPFSKNKPSRSLVLTCAIIIGITILLPYTQFGSDIFQFGAIPPSFYALLVVINIIFLIAVYYMRRWFYSKNAYRLEQSYIPLDKTILGQIR
ncbi:MAG TPA: HAD-IC family P-type ATPase, partial [Candidatus Lokiarchaeia archaeon]|nr:HAD-IC family P-type ATPase [Candidatus Lokiarchaeia archaeon]